ncbi:MAG: methionyl-tRNA formyltransferase [Chloroflexota bacterium]
MRIVLIGQAAFGEKILQSLLEKREEVIAVYAPPSVPGGRLDPLVESAGKQGIPVFQPTRMRDPAVYTQFAGLKADLGIMAFVTDIVPEKILKCPRLETIQYHPSLLPKHRGGSAINWPIINGETGTGLTIFWPDRGIDTGPILLQKEVDILPDDTVGSLYFDKLFPLGVQTLVEAVELVKQGHAPRIPQDESQATYEGLCTEKDSVIDWSQPATKVYNLIRGTNPQPGAITCFAGKKLKIFDSELIQQPSDKAPGQIVECNEKGIVIAGQSGSILAKRVQPEASAKIPAAQYAQAVSLKPGDSFGQR